MTENEGRTAIRRAEWLRHMQDERGKGEVKSPALKNRGQGIQVVLGFIVQATRSRRAVIDLPRGDGARGEVPPFLETAVIVSHRTKKSRKRHVVPVSGSPDSIVGERNRHSCVGGGHEDKEALRRIDRATEDGFAENASGSIVGKTLAVLRGGQGSNCVAKLFSTRNKDNIVGIHAVDKGDHEVGATRVSLEFGLESDLESAHVREGHAAIRQSGAASLARQNFGN